ncbi:MAG: GTP cyclohydrolase I FolE2, partial [Betaproteobacteria bacterium]|nr:GTP cyclohydrolase I FolE2 [Betaproteobacteria bacterium]
MMNEVNFPVADVQGIRDDRCIAIDRAGVRAIRHPVKVADKHGEIQHTVATFNMHVYLPHQFRGAHMSRFVEILNNHDEALSVQSFERMVRAMVDKLGTESGDIEMTFPYFIR